ncbi:MAG: phage protein D [Ascidiaceihabitans sp.]|jgi:phage protein D
MPDGQIYSAEVVDARPVIEVDGVQIPGLSDLLIGLEMREQLGGLSTCEILFSNLIDHDGAGRNFAFEFSETNHFAPGAAIRVLMGDATGPTEVFRGLISAVSFECIDASRPRLRIMAEDGLMGWRMRRRNRSFPAGPLRDVFQALTADTGLTAVITGLNDPVDEQQQLNETDLGFLRRLLARYDADAQVVGTQLHISPRAAVDRGAVTLTLGDHLKSIRVTADLADQRPHTQIHGFSLLAGQTEAIVSSETELGPGEGITGSQMVTQAFPQAVDVLRMTAFQDATEAQTIADVAQNTRTRRFVIAEGTCVGNAALRVGAYVTLQDIGPRFSNVYYATRACHRYDEKAGYVTDFTAETAFLGRL